jgi:hypothetical protein
MAGTLQWVTAAAALRRVCGVAALLGLFAMHGLAVHGAAHAGHGADPIPSVVTDQGHHDHGTGAGAAMADTRNGPRSGATQEGGPDLELLGFAGLCLAVLLAGIAAAVLLSGRIRLPRRAGSANAHGWPARSRRDRDPPCLFALSIQRC